MDTHIKGGVGKMRLVRLVHLSAYATSSICRSYQIKHLTLVYTLSLPLTLLISFFPYSKSSNTCPKHNRHGSSVSVIFTQNNITDPNSHNSNLSPDADLERNPIPDSVFNDYPDLNCTRRT